MKNMFKVKYIPIYLYCVFWIFNNLWVIIAALFETANQQSFSYFYTVFFDINYVSYGVGFARHYFWDTFATIFLGIYCIFCRKVSYHNSMICASVLACISLVPELVYMTLHSGSVFGYITDPMCGGVYYVMGNSLGTILTLLGFAFICIDLTIENRKKLRR